MTVEERRRRRFSEEFRREQVRLIEKGDRTIGQVSKLYEVKRDCIKRWLKKYGRQKLPEMILIQTQEEVHRIKELEEQSSQLKEIIGEQQVELHYLRACMKLAKERLGKDFEKKIKQNC